jgi:hypothetical protein
MVSIMVFLLQEGFVFRSAEVSLKSLAGMTVFFRTSDGYELDLLLKYRAKLWAIEMKLSSSPDRGDLDRLDNAADLVGADKRILISKSKELVMNQCHPRLCL